MTVLIEMTDRDPDVFYYPTPNGHGKPEELARIQKRIDVLWSRYLKLCDVIPLPNIELDELDDEIRHLEKIKSKLWNEWQESLSIEKEI